MMLVTAELRRKLFRNGRNREGDHTPILKIFDPGSRATWLLTQMDWVFRTIPTTSSACAISAWAVPSWDP